MEEVKHKQWDSGSVGKLWQYKFFYIVIKLGGRKVAYFFQLFYCFLVCCIFQKSQVAMQSIPRA